MVLSLLWLGVGGLYVTTVTDIEVIVIARQALLVKVGRTGHERGFSSGAGAGQRLEQCRPGGE